MVVNVKILITAFKYLYNLECRKFLLMHKHADRLWGIELCNPSKICT